jgi:sugar phosphate isomerase/epimerase
MYPALFSTVITGDRPEEVARRTRAFGLRSVQFVPGPAEFGAALDQGQVAASFARWAAAYRAEGITICAAGAYVNLLHRDPPRRQRNLDVFAACLRALHILGCSVISTETGTYTAGDWDHDERNGTPEAWDDLRQVTATLVAVAAREGVTILYEPYIVNVCASAELGARLVREIDSPHLALLMDPTNWFGAATARPEDVASVLDKGFAAERGLFRLAHAKDVAPPRPGREKPELPGPGQGILDYPRYLHLLRQHGYDGPLVIEHLTEAEVPAAVAFIEAQLQALPG